jgi:chromosome segregation ATPase
MDLMLKTTAPTGALKCLLVLLIAFLCLNGQGLASEEDSGQAVAAELQSLSASINRLAAALEAQTGSGEQDMLYEKLNLAIAYLNFRSRRIESLERDVQETRSAKSQIESTLNVWLERQQDMAQTDSGLLSEDERLRNEEIQMRIDLVKERISRLDDEIVSLESRIYELQSQIDSVEEFVQRNLAL